MNGERFEAIAARYAGLRIAVVGDFCLDRYLEIDPAKAETSIETGLPVYNVVRVRSQPGAAGTILNNLVALGVKTVYPVGFVGEDGEGYELIRSLREKRGVDLDFFLQTPDRRTFTYCKPLIVAPAQTPLELNRLDSKNWTPTPAKVAAQLSDYVEAVSSQVDATIVMDQVDIAETGVVTHRLLERIGELSKSRSEALFIADSRQRLRDFPPVCFKMNVAELAKLAGKTAPLKLADVKAEAAALARKNGRPVFVTMAEQGILGGSASGEIEHVPALPVRDEIDVVGAGDAVTANLTCALSSGANINEALRLANAAASIVIHQLGTTGTADVNQLRVALSAR